MRLKKALGKLLLACIVTTIAACNESAAPVAPDPASAIIDSPYFTAAAPTPAELKTMHLNYHTFTMGANGDYLDFVPLPPNAGDVAIEIKTAGAYKMRLIGEKCAYDVRVSPPEGPSFVMNPTTPTNKFVVTKPGQVTARMDTAAANNYSCNIRLAPM